MTEVKSISVMQDVCPTIITIIGKTCVRKFDVLKRYARGVDSPSLSPASVPGDSDLPTLMDAMMLKSTSASLDGHACDSEKSGLKSSSALGILTTLPAASSA